MTGPLTPQLALGLRVPAEARISPDGQHVAYVVGDLAAAGTRYPLTQLMVSESARDTAAPVSPAGGNAASPRWAPDSAALAYLLAPPDGDHGLFVARPFGPLPAAQNTSPAQANPSAQNTPSAQTSPARRLGAALGAVSDPAWSPTGERIAVLAQTPEAEGSRHAGPAWWPAELRTRIWILDPGPDSDPGAATPGSPEAAHVWEYSWSPDGTRIAAVVSDGPGEGQWFSCRLALVDGANVTDLVDGFAREPGEPNPREIYRQFADPVWSPDGGQIAFIMGARSDRDIVGGDLAVFDLRTGTLANLTRGQPMTVTSLAWPASGPLTFAAYMSGQQAVGCADPGGGPPRILWRERASFERFWPRLSRSETGWIAAVKEDPVTPREVWIADVQADDVQPSAGVQAGALVWRQLSDLNSAARSWPHPAFHDVTWQASDGTSLSGILAIPPGDGPLPLVTWIHGGPNFLHKYLFYAAASPWMLGALPELIASQGLAVFLPNPRGSMGWGSEFAEAVIGDMAGADSTDILSGIDHCVARFGLDGDRLGVGGWSYGGFMSAWLITQTSRFGAAMVGAGNVNWRSQHGTSSVSSWDEQYLRDDPYRIGGAFDTRSPLTYAESVTTPTLLAHGENDAIVPPGQALEFATGLRRAGCPVQVRFYEGEGHDFVKRDTQIRLANDITGWFRRWLLG